MAHRASANGLHLSLYNDLGGLAGSFFWWKVQPTFIAVALREEGRLERASIQELRDYCDAVLAKMDMVNTSSDGYPTDGTCRCIACDQAQETGAQGEDHC